MFYDPTRVSIGPGNIGFKPWIPLQDADLRDLKPHLARFTNVDLLDLRRNERITDEGLAALPDFPKLTLIRLTGTGVTEAGIAETKRRYPNCKIVH